MGQPNAILESVERAMAKNPTLIDRKQSMTTLSLMWSWDLHERLKSYALRRRWGMRNTVAAVIAAFLDAAEETPD
jgi:hypothetical protein